MLIEMDKLYKTRNGRLIMVIKINYGDEKPVVGYELGMISCGGWLLNGRVHPDKEDERDLVNEAHPDEAIDYF
jgi:hypothetical protein